MRALGGADSAEKPKSGGESTPEEQKGNTAAQAEHVSDKTEKGAPSAAANAAAAIMERHEKMAARLRKGR